MDTISGARGRGPRDCAKIRLNQLPIYTGQLLARDDKVILLICTAVGAAEGAEPAGVERVAGPVATAAGVEGKVNVEAIGEGEAIGYGVYKLKKTAWACWYE
eukprot:1101060-Pleurochrysis_carterae.AAC.2